MFLEKHIARGKYQEKNLIRWVKALISDEYIQGETLLYDHVLDCHCATGVAAAEVGRFANWRGLFYFGYEADGLHNIFNVHSVPERWYDRTFGTITPWYVVAKWNDDGFTFAAIAGRLTEFLPESDEKTELQFQIADKLQSENIAGQNMDREGSDYDSVIEDGWREYESGNNGPFK